MPGFDVVKVHDSEATPPKLFSRMETIAEKIRNRAFEVFQKRGCAEDRSLEDWLQAERELVQCPEAEVIEEDGRFQVRMAIPASIPRTFTSL